MMPGRDERVSLNQRVGDRGCAASLVGSLAMAGYIHNKWLVSDISDT